MTTRIEWADETWNPMTGCTPVSEGCEHCYAARIAHRFNHHHGGEFTPTFHENRLNAPLHWRKPRRVFVCSMSDLFHEAFTERQVNSVFAAMLDAPQHTYLILTKRPEAMAEAIDREFVQPPSNWWLGVTAENQARADERIPVLLDTPAAVRFVSLEPMLGPVDLEVRHGQGVGDLLLDGLDWVILGGETGPGARRMQLEWALDVYRQCKAAGVPFFFKQWGTAFFNEPHVLTHKAMLMQTTREWVNR